MRQFNRALLLSALFFLSGCAAVQPWEREYLADPIMTQEGEEEERAFDAHLFRARSGGVLGAGGGGAGCGCEQ